VVADHHLCLRTLAQLAGLTEAELRGRVRVSFAKVAEYQKRGAVHFHAIIRLDAATDCSCPACVAPPPAGFTAELLERAVRQAAATVALPCPPVDGDQGVTLVARWGEQLDVHPITEAGDAGELSAEQVAGYVAKYATKGTEALGVTLDHRIGEVELEGLDAPAHVAELVRACWELGGRPGLGNLRLRQWAHMLGFGGHFSTKSRRYSTTLGALRQARVTYAARRRQGDTLPLDAWGRPEDDQAVIVVASWHYLGSGYQSTGEAWLAASAAARAREARRIAKEELGSTTAAGVWRM
jgi:Replication initiator protein, pSAM2